MGELFKWSLILIVLFLIFQKTEANEVCTLSFCMDQKNIVKTPYEKVMDQRQLKVINQMWKFYWDRNYYCFSESQKNRVKALMEKVQYPNVQSESMKREKIRKIVLESAQSLSEELERETRVSCEADPSIGTLEKVRKNLDTLQTDLVQVIDSEPHWLWDKPEFKYAELKRNRIGGQR